MNKKILILGASSDIGVETVKIFLKNNWNVIAHFNKNSAKLKKIKKIYDDQLTLIKLDLQNLNNIKKFLKKKKQLIKNVDSFVSLTGYVKKQSYLHS